MCLTPINLKKETVKQTLNDDYAMQQVPCGRCLECRKNRSNSWYVRLSSELAVSRSAYFVTFTYEENTLCYSDNGLLTLNYPDYQLFCKRLRKANAKYNKANNKTERSIKYFSVGEYGSQTHRPHYHAIIFNVSDPQLIADTWQKGHVRIDPVNDARIFYTLKYCLKGAVNPRDKDPDDDRKPEKALMSKGLGISYLTDSMIKYHKEDVSRAVTMLGNKKVGLPRYFRNKLFNEAENANRVKLLKEFMDDKYDKTVDPLFPQRVEKMYNDSRKYLAKTD